MKYIRALQIIGSELGDTNLSKKDRWVAEFNRAVSQLFPEATQEEIPGYYKLKDDLVFSSNPFDAKSLQMLKVKSVHLPPDTAIAATVTYLNWEEVKGMGGVESLQPTENDVFIYRVGNFLYAIVHSSPTVTLGSQAFHMIYIQDFQSDSRIADDYELSDASNYMMSSSFVRKVINLAVKNAQGGAE